MNRERGPRSIGFLLVAVATLANAPREAFADGESTANGQARTLTARDVVATVLTQNPTMLAALTTCRSAALDVRGLDARYPLTLQLDTSWTKSTTPQLVPNFVLDPTTSAYSQTTAVTTSGQDLFDAGVQLKKHLVEGTDLSLRLDATRQTSSQFFLLPPGTAPVGLAVDPDGTFEAHLGPGYGAALKLTATQPLLRGAGRNVGEADLRAARAQLTTAELSREEAASEVLRDALTAYWEAWYANAAVEIERRARDAAQRQLDDAMGRIRTGSLAPADGLTFETQVATRDEDVVRAESERSHRAAELARLLGAAQSPESVGVPPDGPPEPPEEQGDLRTDAIGASPVLRVLASAVALASVQAETAGDALRPRLDLDGYLQAQGLAYDDVPAALRQLAKGGALSAHIGLTFELPLDDTQHRAQRDRALLAVDTAGHKLEEGRQQVLASLESLRQAEISARRRVALAGQTRELALRQASAEEARFTTGGSTAIQVLQAQDAVRTAELRVARARTDLAQAHLSVVHLVGRLLQEVTRPAETGACAIR